MSTVDLIFLVLGIFYVADAVMLVPPAAVVFYKHRGSYRPVAASENSYGFGGRRLLLSGLLPWVRQVVTEIPGFRWLDGQLGVGPGYLLPPSVPPAPTAKVEAVQVRAKAEAVEVGGAELVLASRRSAQWTADIFRKLSGATDPGRLIDDTLHHSFDLSEAKRRFLHYRLEGGPVLLVSLLMLLFVFGVAPAVYYLELPVLFLDLVAVYLVLLLLTQWVYWHAHRSVFPEDLRQRLKTVLGMIVSPAEAMTAERVFGREVMTGLHPLAVARVACDRREFADLASRFVRALGSEGNEVERSRVYAFLREEGLEPNALKTPPTRDPNSRAYCPRCLQQFVLDEGDCPSCGPVPLTPFE